MDKSSINKTHHGLELNRGQKVFDKRVLFTIQFDNFIRDKAQFVPEIGDFIAMATNRNFLGRKEMRVDVDVEIA